MNNKKISTISTSLLVTGLLVSGSLAYAGPAFGASAAADDPAAASFAGPVSALDAASRPAISPQSFQAEIGANFMSPEPIPAAAADWNYSASAKDAVTPSQALPKGLEINPKTGVISGAVSPQVSEGVYQPRIFVKSPEGEAAANYQILVYRKIDIKAQLVQVQPGKEISITPNVTGGPVSRFELSGPPATKPGFGLPKGLVFDTKTGIISGTVDYDIDYGVYRFIVRAYAQASEHRAVPYTVYKLLVTQPKLTVDEQNPELQAGAFFSYQLQANGFATRWSASGLPKGISVSQGGIMYGWPDVSPGTYHATVTAYGPQLVKGHVVTVSASAKVNFLIAGDPVINPQNVTVVKGVRTVITPVPQHQPGWVYSVNDEGLTSPGSGLPSGLVLYPDYGSIIGTVSDSVQPGIYTPIISRMVPGYPESGHSAKYTIKVVSSGGKPVAEVTQAEVTPAKAAPATPAKVKPAKPAKRMSTREALARCSAAKRANVKSPQIRSFCTRLWASIFRGPKN